MDNKYYRIRAEVNLDAIEKNVLELQKRLKPGVKSCAVIKADGYGHGAVKVAHKIKNIVDFFAVATVEEAIELEAEEISNPKLILGYVHPSFASEAAKSGFRFTVFSYAQALELNNSNFSSDRLKVHIKIDTGMNRIGFAPTEANISEIVKISELPNLEIEGIFTHFFEADGEDLAPARKQFELFTGYFEKLEKAGLSFAIRHCSNSAAATAYQDANLDMVRLGISIYGLYPSPYVKQTELTPALSLISHVEMVKEIENGSTVGYGATFTATSKMRIATVTVGYADGYMRALSNKGYALIRGKRANITGRVCMDQIMLDITDIEGVCEGDEVVLVGRSGDQIITMEEISELAGSFNYEFACDINKRVPRLYISDGKYTD